MPRTKTISDDDLLAACRAVFLDHGLQVPTKRLAERVGVSEGVLFQRFGTKDELFFASMRLPAPALDAALTEALAVPRVDEALLILARAALDYLREHMPAVLLVMAHPVYRQGAEQAGERSHALLMDTRAMRSGFDQILAQFQAATDQVTDGDHRYLVSVLISTLLARALHEQIGVDHAAERDAWLSEALASLAKGYAGR